MALSAGTSRSMAVQEPDELLMPVALHVLPMTEPSSTLSAANSVVVPLRL
jgi:hypothetical protein